MHVVWLELQRTAIGIPEGIDWSNAGIGTLETMRTILLFIFLGLLSSEVLMAAIPSTFDQLIVHIEQRLQHKEPIVVAISGFGGSGKSTLAEKLRLHFGLAENELIQIDGLYGPNRHGPDIFDQTDWPLLIQILETVRAGGRLRYTGKDDKDRPVHRDVALPRVVIVEGVRLLQPRLMPYFDVSVWIDCLQKIALGRAKSRDRLQGEDEETVSLWDTDWGPKDKIYFDTYRPDELAMFLHQGPNMTLIKKQSDHQIKSSPM